MKYYVWWGSLIVGLIWILKCVSSWGFTLLSGGGEAVSTQAFEKVFVAFSIVNLYVVVSLASGVVPQQAKR